MREQQVISVLIVLLTSLCLHSQTILRGTVKNDKGKPLPHASVYLSETSYGTTTTERGSYSIKNLPNGNYTVVVSLLGYQSQEQQLVLKEKTIQLDFILSENVNHLNEVIVSEKTKSQLLRETAYRPSVLELKNAQLKATPVIDMVTQLSGIRVRQQGGLGSDANIMINGISGKGIKTFVDGIPMELLGNGYGLNNISPNLVERIEVYKGVVPVSFASDALGGIINIETQSRQRNYLDASYTLGSWNTHQIGFGGKKYNNAKKTQYLQLDGFLNYSDNNYWMDDVDIVVDSVLVSTEKGRARRFNDRYRSYLGRLQYGFQNISWADDFRILLAGSLIDKQWQHGVTAFEPWGEAWGEEQSFNSLVSWIKTSKNENWYFSVLAGFNRINTKFIDLSDKIYFWDGNSSPQISKGESGFYVNGRTPDINTNNIFLRTTNTYTFNEKHQLNFTALISKSRLQGSDEAGTLSFQEDFYKNPQTFIKSYTGLSLESRFLNDKITNILAAKYYWLQSEVAGLNTDNSFDDYIDNSDSSLGYGNVLKINWNKQLSGYLAYEYTLRLPDGEELFGDGITIGPNPLLVPEKNHNLNIGLNYGFLQHKFILDISTFYRETRDAIFLQVTPRGFSGYLNLLKTRAKGIDASLSYNPNSYLSLFLNGTWQKISLAEPDRYGQIDQFYIGSRIPNSPYLFANSGVVYKIPNLFTNHSRLELTYNSNYIYRFFRSWEQDAANDPNKANTPTQFLHHMGMGYVFPQNKYSLFVECRNLTNQKAYDNYSVQKPGRSFYVKLRMFIN